MTNTRETSAMNVRSFQRKGVLYLGIVVGFVTLYACSTRAREPQSTDNTFVLGTWTGTSTCVGNRPACKNELVVYRFAKLEGNPKQVRLYADKVIDGKRVPMGELDCEVDAEHHTVRSEFTIGNTHGIWEYTVDGDAMTGKLIILPDKTIGRDVKARRVNDDEVPDAPPLSDYAE
jgi:hypothetical protein